LAHIHTFCNTGTETLKRLLPGEIPLNELEIGSEVGSGRYGRVCVGKWKNKYRVALKFCQNREKIDGIYEGNEFDDFITSTSKCCSNV
jgi:hypothetical protein